MAVNIRPLNDRVLIKPMESQESVKGGIIIPDSAKERPQEGKVVAVGPGKSEEEKMSVKIGDKVIYSKYAGTELKLDGEEFLLMREDDILGIIDQK